MQKETLAKIIGATASIISKTLRIEILNDSHYYPGRSVYSFWHGNAFTMLVISKGSNIVIMASKSRDGDLMAGLLEYFGYQVVRGSSNRNRQRRMLELIQHAKNGD